MPALDWGLIAAQGALPFTCGYPALSWSLWAVLRVQAFCRGGGLMVSPEPCMMVLSLPPSRVLSPVSDS